MGEQKDNRRTNWTFTGLVALTIVLGVSLVYVLSANVDNGSGEIDLETVAADRNQWRTWAQENTSLVERLGMDIEELEECKEKWFETYRNLDTIRVEVDGIDNLVVEHRTGADQPCCVSCDVTVGVSSTDYPMWLVLTCCGVKGDAEYWMEEVKDNIVQWESKTKTFHVVMDFMEGLTDYKVLASASLRPLDGFNQVKTLGPA